MFLFFLLFYLYLLFLIYFYTKKYFNLLKRNKLQKIHIENEYITKNYIQNSNSDDEYPKYNFDVKIN